MFSGAAPQKLYIAEMLTGLPPSYNMTDTDANHLAKHTEVEVTRESVCSQCHLSFSNKGTM